MQYIATLARFAWRIACAIVGAYAVLFVLWFLLMMACTDEYPTQACRQNILTTVVLYPLEVTGILDNARGL